MRDTPDDTRRRHVIDRLVLWNIDLTLVDVARVSRDAYAEAFRRVTGRPLVALPQQAGASDSEIFFESLALNEALPGSGHAEDNDLLARYAAELAAAFGARSEQLRAQGRPLPGAREALAAVSRLPGAIQTVITGTIKQNAAQKLDAFGLDRYLDLGIGGYGSDVYPKGTQILRSLAMAAEKYGVQLTPGRAVYVADSVRDAAAAKVADVRCLGVATGRSTISELRDAGADPVLADLADTSRVVAAIIRLSGWRAEGLIHTGINVQSTDQGRCSGAATPDDPGAGSACRARLRRDLVDADAGGCGAGQDH